MFNVPLEQINFGTIHDFCLQRRKEDLDLDYKSDWPQDLHRVICGMANVQGGMILIGIDEIPGTRQPNWPPPGVLGTEDQLHQRALQIAYDAIYPPVMPEIKVCPLNTDPDRSIVVIRIEASRLLHATDGRKRVYVRVVDQGRGYELADLSHLEWLYSQREKSLAFREFILERTSKRAISLWKRDATATALEAYMIPIFPNQIQSIDPSELLGMARLVGQADGLLSDTRLIPTRQAWRVVSGGVFSTSDPQSIGQYLELGVNGLIYLLQEIRPYHSEDVLGTKAQMAMRAAAIMSFCKAFLVYVARLYAKLAWFGPVVFSSSLRNARNVILDHRIPGLHFVSDINAEHFCPDDSVILHSGEYYARELEGINNEMLNEIVCSLMWSFGFSETREQLGEYLKKMRA